mgnify:FL=1
MDKELKKYERDLERSSRLESLTMLQDWSIVSELINELTTTHINALLSDECVNDHNKYLAHKGAIDGLKELQAKFTTVLRQGKQASESIDRIQNG